MKPILAAKKKEEEELKKEDEEEIRKTHEVNKEIEYKKSPKAEPDSELHDITNKLSSFTDMANSLKSTIDDVDTIKPMAVGAEPSAFTSTKVGGA